MNLEELLTHVASEYLDDRTEMLDGDPDELWSDELIVRYLNEAQRIFCRRSWVLIDIDNPTAGRIALVSGKALYSLHKSVLRVYDATYDTDVAPLARVTDAQMRQRPFADPEGFYDLNGVSAATPGSPVAIATDAGTHMLRVFPTPAAAQGGKRLALKVARMPVCYLDLNKTSESPEIPEEWHMSIGRYAAGRCLTMPTVDGEARVLGRTLLAEFDNDVRLARQERTRAEMAPGSWMPMSTTSVIR